MPVEVLEAGVDGEHRRRAELVDEALEGEGHDLLRVAQRLRGHRRVHVPVLHAHCSRVRMRTAGSGVQQRDERRHRTAERHHVDTSRELFRVQREAVFAIRPQ